MLIESLSKIIATQIVSRKADYLRGYILEKEPEESFSMELEGHRTVPVGAGELVDDLPSLLLRLVQHLHDRVTCCVMTKVLNCSSSSSGALISNFPNPIRWLRLFF